MPVAIRFEVPRPVTQDEYVSIVNAIEQIMAGNSFFFGGTDGIDVHIKQFLMDHPMVSNLELVEVDDVLGS